MNLKDIEDKSISLLLHEKYTKLDVNKKVLEVIDKCINNNIRYDINEQDFLSIIDMYYELNHKYDFNYFFRVANNSYYKLDYYRIFKKLDK